MYYIIVKMCGKEDLIGNVSTIQGLHFLAIKFVILWVSETLYNSVCKYLLIGDNTSVFGWNQDECAAYRITECLY